MAKFEINYTEACLLFRLLNDEIKAFIDAAEDTQMPEEDKNYILRIYKELLKKLERSKKKYE